jgi:hypothetical protein
MEVGKRSLFQSAGVAAPGSMFRGLPLPVLLLCGAVVWAFFSAVPAWLFDLPQWFLRLDLALAWAAFAVALTVGFRNPPRTVKVLVAGIFLFGLLELVTAFRADIALTGPALSFALYALPLAVVATLLLTPPTGDLSRKLIIAMLALAFIEVPISIIQTPLTPHPDFVSGTFPGLLLGGHLNGAITSVAALWILGGARSFRDTLWAYPLVLVTLLSDTKQAMLLLPVVLALSPAINVRVWLLRLIAPVFVAGLAFFGPAIPGIIPENNRYVGLQVEETLAGRDVKGDGQGARFSRKAEGAKLVAEELTSSAPVLLFGLGQGQSVSYVALLSNEGRGETLGQTLGLEPPRLIVEELGTWDGTGSFASEFSSLIGIIGDLGLLGFGAFLIGLVAIVLMLWRIPARERGGIQAVGLFYLAMGAIYIWWEQPVFGIYVGIFAGLAILSGSSSFDARRDLRKGGASRSPTGANR